MLRAPVCTAIVRPSAALFARCRYFQFRGLNFCVCLNPGPGSSGMQAKVIELRQLLAERFALAHTSVRPAPSDLIPTGVAALDHLLGGGFPPGEFTELVAERDGSGSAQVLHAWLRRLAADGRYLALIDGMDSFDAEVEEPEVLSRLLWVRCRRAEEALRAADVLLRDRNFPLVALDLKLNPAAQLRRIQSTVWHRFKRLLEQTQSVLLVLSPRPLVSGAACRVELDGKLGLDALERPGVAIDQLRFRLARQAGLEVGVARAG